MAFSWEVHTSRTKRALLDSRPVSCMVRVTSGKHLIKVVHQPYAPGKVIERGWLIKNTNH